MSQTNQCFMLSVAAAWFCSGCGTLANITAPAAPQSGPRSFGPTVCEPFGGVQRSVLAGSIPLMGGPIGIVPAAIAMGVDAPLSLAGDVLTLPIVYYRLRTPSTEDDARQKTPEGSIKPTENGKGPIPVPEMR